MFTKWGFSFSLKKKILFIFLDGNWKCNNWNYFKVSPLSIFLSLLYVLLGHFEVTDCFFCLSFYETVTIMQVGGITAFATLLLFLFALKTNVSTFNGLDNNK